MPEDTIASMVSSTARSVSGMPEFHEFQPIGGVCDGRGFGAGDVHAASTPTQTTKPTVDARGHPDTAICGAVSKKLWTRRALALGRDRTQNSLPSGSASTTQDCVALTDVDVPRAEGDAAGPPRPADRRA